MCTLHLGSERCCIASPGTRVILWSFQLWLQSNINEFFLNVIKAFTYQYCESIVVSNVQQYAPKMLALC